MASKLSHALVAEFVGTFALVFVGAGAGALAWAAWSASPSRTADRARVRLRLRSPVGRPLQSGGHCRRLGGGQDGRAAGALLHRLPARGGGVVAAYACSGCSAARSATSAPARSRARSKWAAPRSRSRRTGAFLLEALLAFFLANTVLNAGISGKAGNPGRRRHRLTFTLNILVAVR